MMHLPAAAFNSHWEPVAWFALGIIGALGLVAVLNPRRISMLAMREGGFVESAKAPSGGQAPAANRFAVLALCRAGGVVVLGAVVATAYFLALR